MAPRPAAEVEQALARLQRQRPLDEAGLVFCAVGAELVAVDVEIVVAEKALVPGRVAHRHTSLADGPCVYNRERFDELFSLSGTGLVPTVKRVAVLASGGLDSAVLIAHLAGEAILFPVYVEAGLAWEAGEKRALRAFLDALNDTNVQPGTALELPLRRLYGEHWSTTG